MKKPLIGALLILSMVAPASFVSALTANYTYDAAGRLTGAEYDIGSSITYAYDANGNLAQRTANTPALDGGPGDINVDGLVNLADVTIVLKVLTGQAPNATIDASNSIDSQAQIGIKDAIYILGEMAR